MSVWLRLGYVLMSLVSVLVLALIYAEAAVPLIDLAKNDLSGPFTENVKQLDAVIPILIAVFVLFLLVYLWWGSAQEERAKSARRRLRP